MRRRDGRGFRRRSSSPGFCSSQAGPSRRSVLFGIRYATLPCYESMRLERRRRAADHPEYRVPPRPGRRRAVHQEPYRPSRKRAPRGVAARHPDYLRRPTRRHVPLLGPHGARPPEQLGYRALIDDCAYWEPLVGWGSRAPVGLHSSWDDETSTRRGSRGSQSRSSYRRCVSIP